MGPLLSAVLGLMFVLLVLMFLSPLCRRAWESVKVFDEEKRAREEASKKLAGHDEPQPQAAQADAMAPAPPVPPEPIDEKETGYYYLRKLLSPTGMLGLLLMPLLVLLFPMNAGILAEGFRTLLNREPTALMLLSRGDWQWEVTDFQIYGLTLNLSLLFVAAAATDAFRRTSSSRWPLSGLVALFIGFEVWLAYQRGQYDADTGDELSMGLSSAAQALVTAPAEVIAGFFSIHQFLLPFLLMVAWAVVSPFRAVGRAFRVRWQRRAEAPPPAEEPEGPGLMTRLLAYFYLAFCKPLELIDQRMASALGWGEPPAAAGGK